MTIPKLTSSALALLLLTCTAFAEATPNVTIELRELDPAHAEVVPPETAVYARIGYTTDAPVRLVLVPYRNGQPVTDGKIDSGSPDYAPGSGETMAWFAFRTPQEIDEIRAIANDDWGNVFAEVSVKRNIVWRTGAAAPPEADWVERLRQAPKNTVAPQQSDSAWGAVALTVLQLVFLCVPASVILQIYAWISLEGGLKRLARISGYAMAALWLFVIVTAVAGSNLSPIWLVFLSPLFVLFLTTLLIVRWRSRRRADTLAASSRSG